MPKYSRYLVPPHHLWILSKKSNDLSLKLRRVKNQSVGTIIQLFAIYGVSEM